MKLFKPTHFLLVVALLTIHACSIKKRVYMNGYHVEWLKSNKSPAITHHGRSIRFEVPINSDEKTGEIKIDKNLLASAEGRTILLKPGHRELQGPANRGKKFRNKFEECDIIYLKNGQEIKAKVLEVGQYEIRYKLCDDITGSTLMRNKSEVFKIKYMNGTSTVIEQPAQKPNNSGSGSSSKSSGGGDRNLLVAVMLWVFCGFLGVHRFYLGHYGIGILYLFTFSLCGIGWIVDGILFLTGELKPKDGEYVD